MSSFRFLAGGLLAAAGAACAADIPLEQFARHPQYEDAALSPDGEYLAAVAVVNGKRMLSLIHLTDFQGVNVAPRGDDELADFLWAGPHRVVYSVGTRLGGLEKPVATAISEIERELCSMRRRACASLIRRYCSRKVVPR